MSARKSGLGRGFDSLIPNNLIDEEFDPTRSQDKAISKTQEIAIDKIIPNPDQPRKDFVEAALQDLAQSIKEHGVIQPLVVTPEDGKYMIIAGERRWRASKIAGLKKVPVVVRTLGNQHKLEVALIENLQREDLSPLETATAYLKLHEQFNLSYDQISQKVGKAVSTVSNILRLLSLPKEAKQALVSGEISEGHARQILAVKESEVQLELLNLIIKNGWSVRKSEQFVVGYKEGKKNKNSAVAKTQTETPETRLMSKKLGTKVKVKNMAKGGQLLITFKNDEEFERIARMLM